MANITGERLKEMEAEMNRFEEEILSTKQDVDFKDIDEREFNNGLMGPTAASIMTAGIRLGPRPDSIAPRLVIHTNTFNQLQSQNKEYMLNSYEMRPPPPPPVMTLQNSQTVFNDSQQPIEQNKQQQQQPYFIPPQLRFRANYPVSQRPFYPMMGPPRPYMMGPSVTGQGAQAPVGYGPSGLRSDGQANMVGANGPLPNRPRPNVGPNFAPGPQINGNSLDNSKQIVGPQIIYSAPPVKRKIESTESKKDSSKKLKQDKDGNKKVKKSKTKDKKAGTNTSTLESKKEELPEQSIPLPTMELKLLSTSLPIQSNLAPNPLTLPSTVSIKQVDAEKEVIPITQGPSKTSAKKEKKEKKNKFVRMAASAVWEDPSLGDWDQDDFRMFCGDLGNEVGDDTLARAFNKYPSFQKARVIRDKRTNKTKGFGFVSFKDPNDFVRAMREMNGRYVGNRPIKLRKSVWQDRQIDNVKKKEREKKKLGFK